MTTDNGEREVVAPPGESDRRYRHRDWPLPGRSLRVSTAANDEKAHGRQNHGCQQCEQRVPATAPALQHTSLTEQGVKRPLEAVLRRGVELNRHEAIIIVLMSSVNAPDNDRAIAFDAVDRSDPTPLHEQVAAEIRRAIRDGEADPGDRIPQARDLATVLGVNSNTVLRALRLLRDEGLIEMGRGRAIRVTGTADRGAVIAKTKELIEFARRHGYRRDELIALMHRLS